MLIGEMKQIKGWRKVATSHRVDAKEVTFVLEWKL